MALAVPVEAQGEETSEESSAPAPREPAGEPLGPPSEPPPLPGSSSDPPIEAQPAPTSGSPIEAPPAPLPDSSVVDLPIEAPAPSGSKVRFSVLPGAFYLPETSVGFGLASSVSFPIGGPSDDPRVRWFPSTVSLVGAYTLRRQIIAKIAPLLYLDHGRTVIEGEIEARNYPDRYFGLGGDASSAYQGYTDRTVRGQVTVRRAVIPRVFVGATLVGMQTWLRRVGAAPAREEDWIGLGKLLGDPSSRVVGLGPTFVWDDRDHPQMTRTGTFLRVDALVHGPAIGSSSRFFRIRADARAFYSFARASVLAGQVVWVGNVGRVPFSQLATVGGPVGMRGYREGRFRDHGHAFAQVELRFPIVWRFRGAVNVATGVLTGPETSGFGRALWSVGAGLRLVVNPERRMLVRADVERGPEEWRLLAYVNEAF